MRNLIVGIILGLLTSVPLLGGATFVTNSETLIAGRTRIAAEPLPGQAVLNVMSEPVWPLLGSQDRVSLFAYIKATPQKPRIWAGNLSVDLLQSDATAWGLELDVNNSGSFVAEPYQPNHKVGFDAVAAGTVPSTVAYSTNALIAPGKGWNYGLYTRGVMEAHVKFSDFTSGGQVVARRGLDTSAASFSESAIYLGQSHAIEWPGGAGIRADGTPATRLIFGADGNVYFQDALGQNKAYIRMSDGAFCRVGVACMDLTNSLVIAVGTTIGSLVLGTLAGYGFARFKFGGSDAVRVLVTRESGP